MNKFFFFTLCRNIDTVEGFILKVWRLRLGVDWRNPATGIEWCLIVKLGCLNREHVVSKHLIYWQCGTVG